MNDDSPALGEAEVRAIARLANLDLSPDELGPMAHELSAILGYVKKLQEVDVEHVAPTAHVQIERLPLRADEPAASLPNDVALREAPRADQGGFAVPGFMEEG